MHQTVGFIGLGIMGKPMAKNILKAGYSLLVYDVNEEAVKDVVSAGAKRADGAKEIGEKCNVIMTMLPNSPHVEEVILGEDGILNTLPPGSVLIDMSSISPLSSQKIAKALAEKNIAMLDAPVSGGEPKAIDGTLSFMVGGEKGVFDAYKPLLETMGSSVVHCGSIGAGNTTKLANQIIVALNIAAVAEAFTLVSKTGVDSSCVFQAIKGGLAGSTVMNAKVPMMLDGNIEPGFKIDLHIKDLSNALETGHSTGAPLPLTAAVMEMMQTLHADGYGQKDHSSLSKYYEKISAKPSENDE